MLFSERMRFTPPREALQLDSMDDALRNGLWNVLWDYCWAKAADTDEFDGSMWVARHSRPLFKQLWGEFLKRRIDELDYRWPFAFGSVKKEFFASDWFRVYDFLEFVVDNDSQLDRDAFMAACNCVLEREMSAYRFVGGELTPITSEEEITEIEEALEAPAPYDRVRSHIAQALALMSDREAPDYSNSIKESISAVEALCQIIVGDSKATLGDALKKLEDEYPLHGALKSAFSNLYGYTNDAHGIRHARGLDDSHDLQFEDAKFMLAACSAFVNYVIAKEAREGS